MHTEIQEILCYLVLGKILFHIFVEQLKTSGHTTFLLFFLLHILVQHKNS